MDSPGLTCRLFGAQRSLHDLLGGGTVADVMLWRRKEVAGGLLVLVAASWVLFYFVPGYTLLSFVSQVLMILLTVLFVWAKAARLLNRAPPPVPFIKISAESMSEAAETVGNYMNKILQDFENIALGKDSSLFYKVAVVLFLTSIVGRLTNLITLVYAKVRHQYFRMQFEEELCKEHKKVKLDDLGLGLSSTSCIAVADWNRMQST